MWSSYYKLFEEAESSYDIRYDDSYNGEFMPGDDLDEYDDAGTVEELVYNSISNSTGGDEEETDSLMSYYIDIYGDFDKWTVKDIYSFLRDQKASISLNEIRLNGGHVYIIKDF